MSLHTVAHKVVELCNNRKNFDVMQNMYAPDIVSVEPTGKETKGQQAVIDKSKKWAAGVEIHGETVIGPFFHGDDRFATKTIFDVTRKDTGERVSQEEISIYTVKDNLITREEFFFAGDKW